jgi:hypothetical protein
MKNILYIVFVLSALFSCNNISKKDNKANEIIIRSETKSIKKIVKIDTANINVYKKELNKWLNYYNKYNIKTENFEFLEEFPLPNLKCKIDTFNLKEDLHVPFYKYSEDRNKILDVSSYNIILDKNKNNELVSFGSDVDSEVSLKDLKNKLWRRILFVGPLYKIEDGFWINNNQFLIVGQNLDTFSKPIPLIWFVDLEKNIIQTFEYQTYIKNMNFDYCKKVIYKNIKEEEFEF